MAPMPPPMPEPGSTSEYLLHYGVDLPVEDAAVKVVQQLLVFADDFEMHYRVWHTVSFLHCVVRPNLDALSEIILRVSRMDTRNAQISASWRA